VSLTLSSKRAVSNINTPITLWCDSISQLSDFIDQTINRLITSMDSFFIVSKIDVLRDVTDLFTPYRGLPHTP